MPALEKLQDIHRRREVDLAQVDPTLFSDDDEDLDRECPVFDKFYEDGGNEGIRKLINFTGVEFSQIYSKMQEQLVTGWNVGRRRKTSQTPMDVFFMSLVVLKHGGSWDLLAKVFDIKPPTFERMICGFMPIASKILCELFVDPVAQEYSMECLEENDARFTNFPLAIEAIDVTLQQGNSPSGNMQEGKK